MITQLLTILQYMGWPTLDPSGNPTFLEAYDYVNDNMINVADLMFWLQNIWPS